MIVFRPGQTVIVNKHMPYSGNVFLDGLRAGQTWTVRRFNPLWAPKGGLKEDYRFPVIWLEELIRPYSSAADMEDPPFGAHFFEPAVVYDNQFTKDHRTIQILFPQED